MPVPFLRRSSVGVVEMFGVIGGGLRVPVYSRILDGLRTDKRFKAVIVEIDSPGGTASGSELLYNSLVRVAREKPVVAYIRGTGVLEPTTSHAPPARSWPCPQLWWAP